MQTGKNAKDMRDHKQEKKVRSAGIVKELSKHIIPGSTMSCWFTKRRKASNVTIALRLFTSQLVEKYMEGSIQVRGHTNADFVRRDLLKMLPEIIMRVPTLVKNGMTVSFA